MRREHPCTERQRAHVSVSTRTQHALTWFVSRGGTEAEAEEAHAKEPWLCCQLPGEARVPARGSGATEEGAPAGGGAARGRERRHATRAGRPGCPSRRPSAFRQRSGVWRRQFTGNNTPSEHSLSHHHSQDPTTGAQS